MHPIIHSLIEVYVVEKSIVYKYGDATAHHRTDIETEWRHRTFPRRFAPLLCRVMSSIVTDRMKIMAKYVSLQVMTTSVT